MTISPIPIYKNIHHVSSQCPKCGLPEAKREVCKHCGYEYQDGDVFGWRDLALVALILLLIILGAFFGIGVLVEWTRGTPLGEAIKENAYDWWTILSNI